MGAKSSQNNLSAPSPAERQEGRDDRRAPCRDAIKPRCLDVCREDNGGDESRVGKQRPCHPLKVGVDSPT